VGPAIVFEVGELKQHFPRHCNISHLFDIGCAMQYDSMTGFVSMSTKELFSKVFLSLAFNSFLVRRKQRNALYKVAKHSFLL